VLTDLTPVFKKSGFRKSSQNFSIESDECWAVINFQKSRWTEADEKTFYINAAVTAKRLMAFDNKPTHKAPPYYSCIWRARAEQFGPDCKTQQWTIRDEESVRSVVEYLRILLQDFVIPAVKSLMSEEALLAKWTNVGQAGYPQLKAKTVLLAGDRKLVELRDTIFALHEIFGRGAVSEGVLSHMEQLRKKFPDVMREL
jgi:Domain of unknown function (DUF4304)